MIIFLNINFSLKKRSSVCIYYSVHFYNFLTIYIFICIVCITTCVIYLIFFFFSRAIRLTGPFVTMIYSMITGDMLTFGIIYTIMLFGFSQSFYFLYKGFPGVKSSLYHSYPSTWMALFQITLGDYNVT